MITRDIVIILFRLINFSISVLITFYLFKKYILPILYSKAATRKNVIESLQKQSANSQEQLIFLEEQLIQQEKLIQIFQAKLDIWNQQFIQQISLRKQEKTKIAEHLDQKINEQKDYIQLYYIQKNINHNV